MKQQRFFSIALLLVAMPLMHGWSETRTPLSLYRGPISFQNYFDWRRDEQTEEGCTKKVFGDYWTALYNRYAPDAFGDSSCGACDHDLHFSNKEPLSTLYFGKACFRVAEAFANGVVSPGSLVNPFVTISTVCPRFTYNEKGAWFGGQAMVRWGCDDAWCAGIRIRAPYCEIDVAEKCSDFGENSITPSDLANLYQTRVETITVGSTTQPNLVFAARLDFLEALQLDYFTNTGATIPFVQYPATDITFAGQVGSGGRSSVQAVTPVAPFLALIDSTDGSMPTSVRWGDVPSNGTTVVQGDGSGLIDLQRGRVANDINYAPLAANVAAQKQLFLVPNVGGVGSPTPGQILGGAQTVYSALSDAISSIQPSVLTFFAQHGIDFCNGRTVGLGDTDFELYLGHLFGDCSWLEGRLGVVAPTGVKVKNPLEVLRQPTGNNGHVELRIGMGAGVQHCRYMRFDMNMAYSWVLRAANVFAAPFVGATVKNLAPCVGGKSSWQHFEANFNWTFLNPRCDCMGVLIGYQAYVKNADKICLNAVQVADFNGNLQTVNPEILMQNTYRMANKVKTEAFFNGECMDIFLGFTSVVSGKNIAHETDMHIGINVRF
jgi:hypothetical protein